MSAGLRDGIVAWGLRVDAVPAAELVSKTPSMTSCRSQRGHSKTSGIMAGLSVRLRAPVLRHQGPDCRVYRLSVDAEVIYMSDKSPSGWADSTTSLDAENLLWKQYIVYVDLFKVYVDNALRPCIWFYAITGALLSFYIDHIGSGQPYLPYALLFPMLLA